MIDQETSMTGDPVDALGRTRALAGASLAVLPSLTIFPEDFATFWCEGRFREP